MTFDEAVNIILKHEGGYSHDSLDPGGETNFGICKRSYPNIDIKNLTKEKAMAIYRADFWDKLKIESLPRNIRLLYFDCAVNQGPARAQKFYLEAAKSGEKLAPSKFAMLRLSNYTSLPGWSRFGAGWTKRLFDVTIQSLQAG